MPQRLGDLLVKEKVITSEQLEQAYKFQKDTHTLEFALVKLGFLSDEDVTNFKSRQYGVPAINNLSYLEIDPAVVKLIPYETAKWLQILPMSRVGSSLTIAMVDPINVFAKDEIKFMTGFNIEPVVASESSIIEGIEKAYGTSKDGTRKVERVDLADGRKASDVTNSPDGTVKERGMPQSVHPLDNWFYRKPRIQQAGIEAILIDEPWGQFLSKHHHWTTDEVVRVRCLLRPQPEDIEQFLARAVFDGEPPSSSSLDAWRRPEEECFAGCVPQVSSWPNDIFHFSCKFDATVHGASRLWGCTAREFTSEWALFSVHGDERLPEGVVPQGFNQYPLGFIKNSQYLKSAALLLSKALNHGDQFSGSSLWKATSIVGNIAPEEVYRMLLASCGFGTSRVLRMSADTLKEHRPTGAEYGYETIENVYQLGKDYEFCPICNHVNEARSYDIGMCQHFVGKYGEGEIGDNLGVFSNFEHEWTSLLTWCEEKVDELGEPKLERLVSKACRKLKLPREVAKLLTEDPRDPQCDAICAFQKLFDLKAGKDYMGIFYNLYFETPGQIEKLTKSLGRMSQLLQGGKLDSHRNVPAVLDNQSEP